MPHFATTLEHLHYGAVAIDRPARMPTIDRPSVDGWEVPDQETMLWILEMMNEKPQEDQTGKTQMVEMPPHREEQLLVWCAEMESRSSDESFRGWESSSEVESLW